MCACSRPAKWICPHHAPTATCLLRTRRVRVRGNRWLRLALADGGFVQALHNTGILNHKLHAPRTPRQRVCWRAAPLLLDVAARQAVDDGLLVACPPPSPAASSFLSVVISLEIHSYSSHAIPHRKERMPPNLPPPLGRRLPASLARVRRYVLCVAVGCFAFCSSSNSLINHDLPLLPSSLPPSLPSSFLFLFRYLEESWESVRPMDNPPGYDEAHGITPKDKPGDQHKRWYVRISSSVYAYVCLCRTPPPLLSFLSTYPHPFLPHRSCSYLPCLQPSPTASFSPSPPSSTSLPQSPTPTAGEPPWNTPVSGNVPFVPGAILSITTHFGGREGWDEGW